MKIVVTSLINANFLAKTTAGVAVLIILASTYRFYNNVMRTQQQPLPLKQHSVLQKQDQKQPNKIDFNELADWHLFGVQQKISKPQALDTIIDAPQTRLSLKLLGTFNNNVSDQSLAIIESSDQQQKAYRIGDKLPGNAELTRIDNNRIVLLRAGKHEALNMQKSDAFSMDSLLMTASRK